MSDLSFTQVPPEQQAIRNKCFHPLATFIEFPIEDVESSIPIRFEKIVRLHAERIAVKTETRSVTYTQLNEMANRFAHALLERQGRRAELVAILLEKDVAQVAAMLGAMKAGKFFLILDPSFPKNRLIAMLEGARAKLVVTNRRNDSLANEISLPDCELMEWESIDESIVVDNPEISIAPKGLAFINYTSGSTGEPKGLLRNHRMILHNIMLRTNLIHVCKHDRISLLSSGTSNAITNSLLALLNGSGLYSLEVKREGVPHIAHWLAAQDITIAPMSSTFFRNLCETLKGNNTFPTLRVVRLRSEAVYKSDVDLYKRYFSPDCIFVTGLSSNETGPLADYMVDHDTELNSSEIPIGYAAPEKHIVLLDQDGKNVGFEEIGEIAVRSRYLSPGYLRNPRLARTKFKWDPSDGSSRIYLTGDMATMLPDGCLVYKGRKDFRLKVRGYPVDIKEVETALREHPGLRDAVVIARSNQSEETILVAYFVTATQEVPTVSELRRFLGQTLPAYMIPAAFVRLNSMPLNPQNKVDRAALPAPAETRPDLDIPFMAPRGEQERGIAEIWAEVLGIDRVGIQDNFFDLGGHSLAAIRIVSRAIEKFKVELPLQLLFDSPTVETMAAVITVNQSVGYEPGGGRAHRATDTLLAASAETIIDPLRFPKEVVEESIPERFEKIVRLYPDRTAVKTRNEAMTYSQLNSLANGLAHEIVARRGARPEAIAIYLENSASLMAAMLAVLKAGKFFVLLDRGSPKIRLKNMLEDSQAQLLISTRQYESLLTNSLSLDLLDIQAIGPRSCAQNLGVPTPPDSLAAINYTSGSTGEPKGVLWTHRNLLHQVMLFTNAYELSEFDRLLLATSGTGNAVTIGFLALLNGAAVLPFNLQAQGINHLIRWLRDERITICWVGSPLFRSLCQELGSGEKISDVRILRLASEASHRSDIELYQQHFSPKCRLINGLSSTEAGLVRLYTVDPAAAFPGNTIPVGYAVEDKDVLLLDDSGKEVGFHQVGEIAVRSRYLSPGYWRKPELTANKFKPDPYDRDKRLYLTGDLGIMISDGCLIHKGRKDFRVKIRGYGVEVEEVEKVLKTYPTIEQSVVVARRSSSGESRLIAYYTCRGSTDVTASEMRAFLGVHLPNFMLPHFFVRLETIPLTYSGKVDRRALPDPDKLRRDLVTSYLPPRNELEKQLVSVWESVLDVRPIGVRDEFFDLGGDSLSAMRVVARVSEQLKLELSLDLLFQSPTVVDMAVAIERHLSKVSENITSDCGATTPAVSRSRDDFLPLSFSQQRLWFLDQLDPGSFTYNLFAAYRFKGDLNLPTLEESFNEIVRRHEVLRTLFKSRDGNPVQFVLPHLAIKLPLVDLRALASEEARWTETRQMFRQEAQRPFDLSTGPLLRIILVQLADDEYVLLRSVHHIVFDGWSEGVLFRELSEIYATLSIGQPLRLANLPLQYGDYAKWQRQAFHGERLDAQLSYWKKQLDNISTLNLPTDLPRQAVQMRSGARRYFALSEKLSSELKNLSRDQGVTLFMTLLAAYQTLLHRYSQQTDIAIGSPVAGRNRKEFDQLIGFFLNMLVLRLDLSGNPTFAETMRRAREVCLGALSHQELPFEKLVEEIHPDREMGQNPLFQVTFAFQNTPRVSLRLPITVEEVEVETGIARFDLHLFIEEVNGYLKGYFDYDSGLFNADTVERMVGHFQTLLEGIIGNPEQPISELPLLTDAEKHQLIEWNNTKTDYLKEDCIHQLFEAQVEFNPNAVAVVYGNDHLTYGDLNALANRVARRLRAARVGPDVLVGVCVERSPELVVGILAVLKAGGAYVPLDPSYPKERLAFMLRDADVSVLLTQKHLFTQLPESNSAVIYLDIDDLKDSSDGSGNDANLESETNPDHLAYVIYTSGSTGEPKGVAVSHRAINRLVINTDYVQITPADVFAQVSNISFDAATFEIWGALLNGARLIMIPNENVLSPQIMSEAIESHGVTTLFLTTALFNLMVEQTPSALGKLRYLLFGGEAVNPDKVRKLLSEMPPEHLLHVYGPTESTTFTSWYRVQTVEAEATTVPIGRPIANTEIYILDSHRNPVTIGVSGEIYIGGDGLAREYLNQPQLTAEKFITHSFDGEPAKRLYQTGDRARYLPDGNIEFLGRVDDQVKIRGYRIELGEIESVLRGYPEVRQCAVAAREDTPGDKRLIGYVVMRPDAQAKLDDMRGFLKQKLPLYMIPSVLLQLDELPLSPNGKVDRKALPAPDGSRPELEKAYMPPRTPIEQTLVEIWREILRLERVGIHDNFFELGGHSLLATKVISRVRDALKIDLPLRILFEMPTIQGLAQNMHSGRDQHDVIQNARIVPAARKPHIVQATNSRTTDDNQSDICTKVDAVMK